MNVTGHPAVVDRCSELLVAGRGGAGRGARSAVGVVALALGIPVEVEAVVRVGGVGECPGRWRSSEAASAG